MVQWVRVSVTKLCETGGCGIGGCYYDEKGGCSLGGCSQGDAKMGGELAVDVTTVMTKLLSELAALDR